MASKWKIASLITGNNEQAAILWVRNGIAALGEPSRVERIEYYDTETERMDKLLGNRLRDQSPNFSA